MKLESLKSSKFEQFRKNEIQNLFSVFGGTIYATSNADGTPGGEDQVTDETSRIKGSSGGGYDLLKPRRD